MSSQEKNPGVVSQEIKPQAQDKQTGEEKFMDPRPQSIRPEYKGGQKLSGKVAVITGGDSGIGRATAMHFSRESAAGIAIVYKDEAKDAQETIMQVNAEGCPSCLAIAADNGDAKVYEDFASVVREFGGVDVLVLNAAEQHLRDTVTDISPEQLQRVFKTNILRSAVI